MKYLLDSEKTFSKSFIFWVTKFAVNKILTTSQRSVKNKNVFNSCIDEIEKSKTKEELDFYFKKIRNSGFEGLHLYHTPLLKLYKFLFNQKVKYMIDIDHETIVRFLSFSTMGLSNATKKNYRVTITNFFNYIDSYNANEKGNTHNYKFDFRNWEKNSIVPKPNIPIFLEEDEIKRFLISLDDYKSQRLTYRRNSYMIKLVLLTGLRSTELLNLRYEDITEKNDLYKISVIGKGNKYREVFINKKHLEEYLNKNYLRGATKDLIFRNFKGEKLSQAYVSGAVDKVLTMAKIKKAKKGTHLLRHTFATQLYRKRKDVFLIKEALGHADINTSMIYTHLDDNELEKVTDIMDELI